MGTQVRAEVWHSEIEIAQRALQQVMAEMHRIDQAMSPYSENSELRHLNRQASNSAVIVSAELFDLIARAQQISRISDGAFDISFASVGHFYSYRLQRRPTEQERLESLPAIGFEHVKLNKQDRSVHFTHPRLKIDLGGIAKGHAVDSCIDLLRAQGIEHALVMAGGDTRLLGDKRDRPWVVGIRDPRDETKQAVKLPLVNEAISTSGDYERFYFDGNERVHHIINPLTGNSASTVQSVSVIGPDATSTDALSTTVFVLGVEKGLRLIESLPGIETIIIDSDRKMHFSSGLEMPRHEH